MSGSANVHDRRAESAAPAFPVLLPRVDAPSDREIDTEAQVVMRRVARTFDLAARLLPGRIRADVRRLYLVLRTLDDLVDHRSPDADVRVAAVERWARGARPDGREAAILDELALRHPGLPRDAVLDFCAGMRFDLAHPTLPDGPTLDRYCYLVAGTVGRLMAVVLGVRDGRELEADAAARALGGAMQRTNILRDIVEDARSGRVYLPDDDLRAAGLRRATAGPALEMLASWPAERRRALLATQIARADADYETGLAGVRDLRAGGRAITAAGRMYRQILREIERDGYGGSGRRAVVPAKRKVLIVAAAAMAR